MTEVYQSQMVVCNTDSDIWCVVELFASRSTAKVMQHKFQLQIQIQIQIQKKGGVPLETYLMLLPKQVIGFLKTIKFFIL